jgi:hypothetical protein
VRCRNPVDLSATPAELLACLTDLSSPPSQQLGGILGAALAGAAAAGGGAASPAAGCAPASRGITCALTACGRVCRRAVTPWLLTAGHRLDTASSIQRWFGTSAFAARPCRFVAVWTRHRRPRRVGTGGPDRSSHRHRERRMIATPRRLESRADQDHWEAARWRGR